MTPQAMETVLANPAPATPSGTCVPQPAINIGASTAFNTTVSICTGIVKPTMIVQMLTVVLNAVLAPILIAGWGTHVPLGVAGAGFASTVSIACGVIFLWVYFARLEHYVALHPAQWRPRSKTLMRLLAIGLPAGGEFFMML